MLYPPVRNPRKSLLQRIWDRPSKVSGEKVWNSSSKHHHFIIDSCRPVVFNILAYGYYISTLVFEFYLHAAVILRFLLYVNKQSLFEGKLCILQILQILSPNLISGFIKNSIKVGEQSLNIFLCICCRVQWLFGENVVPNLSIPLCKFYRHFHLGSNGHSTAIVWTRRPRNRIFSKRKSSDRCSFDPYRNHNKHCPVFHLDSQSQNIPEPKQSAINWQKFFSWNFPFGRTSLWPNFNFHLSKIYRQC